MISALIWGYKMQLGYVGSNWYSVSDQFIRDAQARGESICAPGYAYNGQNQCVKVADTPNATNLQPAPPVNINVSPSISSQVSPQISPAFQQQFQPSNSPASAGTSQVAPTNQNSAQTTAAQPAAPVQSGYSAAEVENMLRQQQAQYAAMLDQAMSAQASQPAPLPSMPAVNVDQSAPVPVAPVIPALPGGASNTPELTNAPASDNKAGILLALAGIVGLLAFRKGKNNATRR